MVYGKFKQMIIMSITGQSQKEKEFLKKIQNKNQNRTRLPRGPRK